MNPLGQRSSAAAPARRGNARIGALIVLAALLGLLYATNRAAHIVVRDSHLSVEGVRARYLAEAGAERAMNLLAQTARSAPEQDPLANLNLLFSRGSVFTPFVAEPLNSGDALVGTYSVTLTARERTPTSITIKIESTGYLPAATPAAQREPANRSALRATVRYRLAPSRVFEYAYFIDNWGWFNGQTLVCRGNVRSNGQFDAGGASPTITAQALYENVSWNGSKASLGVAREVNQGGIWSGWAIVGAQNLNGTASLPQNQHDFQAPLRMPNLTSLAAWEASALQQQGSITIAGQQVCDGVVGDEPGEPQNLYLVGTSSKPIVLNGPVVVRGNVILSGCVTGQGAIYSGANIYCPNSITYKNPPAPLRPADNSQSANEAWLTANWNNDFLCLFARENVVVGDFTDPAWQHYQTLWMADRLNVSNEDCGADGIANTRAGRDGILGTADDDVLEGDGLFSIQHYSQQDADLGLVPQGARAGDPIPGTGEDIDGDSLRDVTTTLDDVILTTPLDSSHWCGNLPAGGIPGYRAIASMNATCLDAVIYTNHSFCWTVLGSEGARINGALICRNENIVHGTPTLEINYDCRLLGGRSGRAARLLPSALQAPEVLQWTQIDEDPNGRLMVQ